MPDKSHHKKILILHGPNLNMLGKREPDIYGHESLAEIDARLKEKGEELGIDVETFQSNHEGALVDKIQQAVGICPWGGDQSGRLHPYQRRHQRCACDAGYSGCRDSPVQYLPA